MESKRGGREAETRDRDSDREGKRDGGGGGRRLEEGVVGGGLQMISASSSAPGSRAEESRCTKLR